MKILVKNGITIPKSYITPEIYKEIKKDLIIPNPTYINCLDFGKRPMKKTASGYEAIPPNLNFMKEYGDRLELPRGYADKLKELLGEVELKYSPSTDVRAALPYELPNINLYDYQTKASKDMLKKHCGILCSPAASGKTIIGIDIAAKLGLKILWLVHLDRLMKQAVDSFLFATGCSEDVVATLSEGKYNIGSVFTAAIVDTARTYKNKLAAEGFGTVILDECHRTPTKKVFDVLMNLSPERLYGLSATPYRSDGLDMIMKYMLGTNMVEVSREALVKHKRIITPKVEVTYTNILIDSPLGSGYPKFMKSLIENKERNTLILKKVLEEVIEDNICLILTDRVSHAKILNDMLSKIYPFTAVVSGRSKKKEADKIITKLKEKEVTVLITTYQFLGEGFDLPLLNRLFFTTPFKAPIRCEQAIGRIQRTHIDGKTAKLYDFCDANKLTRFQLAPRLEVYGRLGCDVSFSKAT